MFVGLGTHSVRMVLAISCYHTYVVPRIWRGKTTTFEYAWKYNVWVFIGVVHEWNIFLRLVVDAIC